MKRPPESGETSVNLAEPISRLLNMYALAASAAGVTLLASADPAEAKIIYTPAHVKLGMGGVLLYGLDLDRDGVDDFIINASRSASCDPVRCIYGSLVVYPRSSRYSPVKVNGIAVRGGKFPRSLAQALYAGVRIGPHRRFATATAEMAGEIYYSTGSRKVSGHWINVKNRYLGFKFRGKGGTHYGWARLSVHVVKAPWSLKATLTGYAYETIPNKPIIAGKTKGAAEVVTVQPGSLGQLALGRK